MSLCAHMCIYLHGPVYAFLCMKTLCCLGPGFVSLESKEHRGKYVGSNGDGDLEIRSQTSDHTKFYVIPVEPVSYLSCILIMT